MLYMFGFFFPHSHLCRRGPPGSLRCPTERCRWCRSCPLTWRRGLSVRHPHGGSPLVRNSARFSHRRHCGQTVSQRPATNVNTLGQRDGVERMHTHVRRSQRITAPGLLFSSPTSTLSFSSVHPIIHNSGFCLPPPGTCTCTDSVTESHFRVFEYL